MQKLDFLSIKEMKFYVERLKKRRPRENHGSIVRGHYSVTCLQQALQRKGYGLLFLNKMGFLKHKKKFWHERLAATTFRHVIIIGQPEKQKKGVSHCIARVQLGKKAMLVCPDEGERKPCTTENLRAFLPNVEGAYAIVRSKELLRMKHKKEIPKDALF